MTKRSLLIMALALCGLSSLVTPVCAQSPDAAKEENYGLGIWAFAGGSHDDPAIGLTAHQEIHAVDVGFSFLFSSPFEVKFYTPIPALFRVDVAALAGLSRHSGLITYGFAVGPCYSIDRKRGEIIAEYHPGTQTDTVVYRSMFDHRLGGVLQLHADCKLIGIFSLGLESDTKFFADQTYESAGLLLGVRF